MSDSSGARQLGFLVHDVARLLRRRFDQRAQGSGLTGAQWHVLAALKRHEGLNQSGLAELMDMEPITLSRHIDRLESAGFVDRRPDPADRRAHLLFLGGKVAPLFEEMRHLGLEVLDQTLAGVSAKEASLLTDILTRMRTNLSGKSVAPDAPSPSRSNRKALSEPTS